MAADLKTALLIALQTTGEERVRELRQSLIDLGISADKAEELAKGLDTELAEIARSAEQAEKKSLDLVTALKTVAGAAIVREFFQVNASFESMTKTLELVTGSTAGAAQEMAFIRAEANRLGVEVGAAASSYVNLAASAKGTSLEGQATREIWSAVVGTMAQLGKSSADVEGAIVQLGQGISKGRFELEDLKSIAERIPGFFKLFADQLGVTTEELFDMISAGELTADKLPELAKALQNLAGAGGVDTANAALARLKNTWTDVQVSLGETGGLTAMTTFLKGATVAVAGLWEGVEILGKTFGNLAFTIKTLDFDGYRARQREILAEAKADLDRVIQSTFGANEALQQVGDTGAQAGAQIADGAKVAQVNYKVLTEEIKAASTALKAENGFAEVQTRLAIEQQKTALELAKAKGDVAGQTEAKNRITELEIELSRLQAQASIAEATAALELAQAKYQEALAKRENVAAAEAELNAASYNYAVKQTQAQITEELASRTRQLADVNRTLTTATLNTSAAVGDMGGSMSEASGHARRLTGDIHDLADAEERLAQIRDQRNESRTQGGGTNWEYLLGARQIQLTTEQLAVFRQNIDSVYQYLSGTFDGQVVSSTYLLEEAIRRAVELATRSSGGATTYNTSQTTPTAGGSGGSRGGSAVSGVGSAIQTTAVSPSGNRLSGGGITINVMGDALDAEALARRLAPELSRLNRFLA